MNHSYTETESNAANAFDKQNFIHTERLIGIVPLAVKREILRCVCCAYFVGVRRWLCQHVSVAFQFCQNSFLNEARRLGERTGGGARGGPRPGGRGAGGRPGAGEAREGGL